MAEDGMLLNFELSADTFAPKVNFKGGRWKDRMIAKKTTEWKRNKINESASLPFTGPKRPTEDAHAHTASSEGHPAKRQRTEALQHHRHPANDHSRAHNFDPSPSNRKSGPKEVVSSLFTYNRKSANEETAKETEEDNPVAPSNAPLDEELGTFTQLGLSSTLANHLVKKLDLKTPTAIQQKAIQHLCTANSDAFIQAQTGSGKTLAYLLPIIQRISEVSKQMKASGQNFGRESGLFAIILAPTRELSKQISSVLEGALSSYPWIVSGIVIGGEKKKSEKARLRKGVNILVATPGRLIDHMDHTEVIDFSRVRWLVLDEGDRLMELGFEHDIQKLVSTLNLRSTKQQKTIIPGLPDRRMTVLCSATIRADVDKLHNIALKNAVSIRVDKEIDAEDTGDTEADVAFSAPAQLKQSYAIVPAKQRLVTLAAVLKQAFKRKGSVMKAIVFISCADSVDFHFDIFARDPSADNSEQSDVDEVEKKNGHRSSTQAKTQRSSKIPQGATIAEHRTSGIATTLGSQDNPVHLFRLHGSLPQAVRTNTLKLFSQSTQPAVLVCTDVASRGLDMPNIDFVVEYDPPFSKDDHLHRVGRTARAGKDGRALIFLQPGCEEGYAAILKDTKPRSLTRHDAEELLKKGFSPAVGGTGNKSEWEDKATDWQLGVEKWAIDHPKHLEQARRAFQSHVRAYATHVAAERAMFDMQQLHLGHLAKAFALRDRPGEIRVPGLRPGQSVGKKNTDSRKREAGRKSAKGEEDQRDGPNGAVSEHDNRRMMQAKVRDMMGGASEFNLG